jgi:hypothetical protein
MIVCAKDRIGHHCCHMLHPLLSLDVILATAFEMASHGRQDGR